MSNVNGFFSLSLELVIYCLFFVFTSLIYLSAHTTFRHTTKFIYSRCSPGRKCDDDGDKRWWTLVCLPSDAMCVLVTVCPNSYRAYVYYFAMKRTQHTSHMFVMEFRQIYCEMSTSAPGLFASFGIWYIPFVRFLKNQNLSVFGVFVCWRARECFSLFLFLLHFPPLNSTHMPLLLLLNSVGELFRRTFHIQYKEMSIKLFWPFLRSVSVLLCTISLNFFYFNRKYTVAVHSSLSADSSLVFCSVRISSIKRTSSLFMLTNGTIRCLLAVLPLFSLFASAF